MRDDLPKSGLLATLLVLLLAIGCQEGSPAGGARAGAGAEVVGAMTVTGDIERRLELTSSRLDPAGFMPEGTESLQLVFRGDDPEWPGARLNLIAVPVDLEVAAYALKNSDLDVDLHFTPPSMADNTDRFRPDDGALAIERFVDGKFSGRLYFEAEEYSFKPRDQRRRIQVEATFEGIPLIRP